MEVLPCRWARFGFTRREIDVAGLLILGLTNKEIGRTLTIAVGTVNVHVAEILRKTVAGTRTQAAYRLGSGI
jgi:DNA-binding NarL/FixJ family response regulator